MARKGVLKAGWVEETRTQTVLHMWGTSRQPLVTREKPPGSDTAPTYT